MPATRKLVRDAIRTALADGVSGFNAQIASVASTYGITPFTVDWAPEDSSTFIQSYIDAESEPTSRLTGIRVALYTSASQTLPTGEREKGSAFNGTIHAHVDFWVEFAQAEDVTDDLTEPYADAIEDAIISCLVDPNAPNAALFQGPYVYFGGEFACMREPIIQTEDGYSQRLPFTLLYEVSV